MDDYRFLGTSDDLYYGNYNDIQYSNHDIVLIDGDNRIRQDVVKILSTDKGTNPIFEGYGSDLPKVINSNVVDVDVQTTIKNTIIYAISYLDGLETSESDDEQIDEIKTIVITLDPNDPRIVYVTLGIILKNGELLTIILSDIRGGF